MPAVGTPPVDSFGRRVLGGRGSIRRLIGERLLMVPVVLVGVSFLVFVLANVSGAFPNSLDQPLLERYGTFLNNTIHLRLGPSLARPETVGELIRLALPPSIQLTVLASAIAIVVSAALASLAALNDGRRIDRIISWATAAGQAVPDFVLALIVLEVFGVIFKVIPAGGYVPIGDGVGPWLSHLIAPACVLAVPFVAAMTRVARASLVEELAKDYVRTARGAGVPQSQMILRNVLPNAMAGNAGGSDPQPLAMVGRAVPAVTPKSIGIATPVIAAARVELKYATRSATSSGRTIRGSACGKRASASR